MPPAMCQALCDLCNYPMKLPIISIFILHIIVLVGTQVLNICQASNFCHVLNVMKSEYLLGCLHKNESSFRRK